MICLDHLIVGVKNLEEARASFQRDLGVLPKLGGRHPQLGTKNALASLDEGRYFEFLAEASDLRVQDNPVLQKLRSMKEFEPFGWALQCDDFEEVRVVLKKCGLELSSIGTGSRQTPEGELLKYEFADILGVDQVGAALPFVVKWVDTVHPSISSPKGCELERLIIRHKASPLFSAMITSLNLGVELESAHENSLQIRIRSSRGNRTFGNP